MFYLHRSLSPLGAVTLESDGQSLTGLWFEGQRHFMADLTEPTAEKNLPVFGQAERWLTAYFSGKAPDFAPPLRLHGTAFQKTVWDIVCTIPYGETAAYGEIAALAAGRLGRARMSAQAVGAALGHNPVCLIVPCHRVIGANGSLTGYAGGLEKKAYLLALESGKSL